MKEEEEFNFSDLVAEGCEPAKHRGDFSKISMRPSDETAPLVPHVIRCKEIGFSEAEKVKLKSQTSRGHHLASQHGQSR